jgi:hypothetical protein
MTEQQPNDSNTAPTGEAMADEPIPGTGSGSDWSESGDGAAAGTRAKEWIAQLEAMIQEVATQAAPAARQIGAKAAELAAVAATKAGPAVQKAGEVTAGYSQRFAERAQSVATELRSTVQPEGAEGTEGAVEEAASPAGGEEPGATAEQVDEKEDAQA